MALIRDKARQPLFMVAFLMLLAGGALAMYRHNFSLSNVYLLPFVLPLCWLILRYGQEAGQGRVRHGLAALVIGGAFLVARSRGARDQDATTDRDTSEV